MTNATSKPLSPAQLGALAVLVARGGSALMGRTNTNREIAGSTACGLAARGLAIIEEPPAGTWCRSSVAITPAGRAALAAAR
jgi:hypothetical protein